MEKYISFYKEALPSSSADELRAKILIDAEQVAGFKVSETAISIRIEFFMKNATQGEDFVFHKRGKTGAEELDKIYKAIGAFLTGEDTEAMNLNSLWQD